MARKIDKQQAAAGEPSAAESLAVLDPNVSITLAGRAITVREYGFFEGLRVAAKAEAFIGDLHNMVRGDGEMRFDRIRHLFGVHEDAVVAIAAQAADVEPEWVRGLGKADIEIFLSTWFGVNAGFFVNEVVLQMREERQRAVMASRGPTSSPASPPPASEISPASESSPSVN
jgi:hypothetical protein